MRRKLQFCFAFSTSDPKVTILKILFSVQTAITRRTQVSKITSPHHQTFHKIKVFPYCLVCVVTCLSNGSDHHLYNVQDACVLLNLSTCRSLSHTEYHKVLQVLLSLKPTSNSYYFQWDRQHVEMSGIHSAQVRLSIQKGNKHKYYFSQKFDMSFLPPKTHRNLTSC